MNVLKKVKGILSGDAPSFGLPLPEALPGTEQAAVYKRILENPGRLALANSIAGEFARLACLELDCEVSGSKRAEFLNSELKKFLSRMREITETCAGLGGVVLKPYVRNKKIRISCVTPDRFVPTDIGDDGKLRGGVFVETILRDGRCYRKLESHRFSGDEYVIENRCFVSDRPGGWGKEIPIDAVEEWKDLSKRVAISGLSAPLFVYFKMPTETRELPMGEAVFARAIGLIEDAEAQYARLLWEFESGERALYVDDAAIRRSKDGKPELPDKR